MVIHFSEYGTFLATRPQAKEISMTVKEILSQNPKVIFDLRGVQSVSLSFSDEFFYHLIRSFGFETFKSKTHFINANEAVSAVLSAAIGLNMDQAEA